MALQYHFVDPPEFSDGLGSADTRLPPTFVPLAFNYNTPAQSEGFHWYINLGRAISKEKNAVLRGLPPGYTLVEKTTMGMDRISRYIAGHPSGLLYNRSTQFMPHLEWLNATQQSIRKPCVCILCKHNSQYSRDDDDDNALPDDAYLLDTDQNDGLLAKRRDKRSADDLDSGKTNEIPEYIKWVKTPKQNIWKRRRAIVIYGPLKCMTAVRIPSQTYLSEPDLSHTETMPTPTLTPTSSLISISMPNTPTSPIEVDQPLEHPS